MKYLCLIYSPQSYWPSLPKADYDKLLTEYMTFTDDLKKSGHYLSGEGLQPTDTATTVRVRGGKVSTTDGPFAETKEYLGGFYLVEAKDLDNALKIAARIPTARFGSIEVRPVMELG